MTNKKKTHMTDEGHEYIQEHKNDYHVDVKTLEDHRLDRGREKERSHVASDIRAEKKGNNRKPQNKE